MRVQVAQGHAPAWVERAHSCMGHTHGCAWSGYAHAHTRVAVRHTCPDTPDLACTFAQTCTEPVHTPTNTHVCGSGVSVTHMHRADTRGSSTCVHTWVRQTRLHSCAWTRHTHGSDTHVYMHMHGAGARTHTHARSRHTCTCAYMHVHASGKAVRTHVCGSGARVHTCMDQTHTDLPHAPHVTGPGTQRHRSVHGWGKPVCTGVHGADTRTRAWSRYTRAAWPERAHLHTDVTGSPCTGQERTSTHTCAVIVHLHTHARVHTSDSPTSPKASLSLPPNSPKPSR